MQAQSYPLLGLSRLRMNTDGAGVTTLVAGAGCPLSCKWCINAAVLRTLPEQVSAQTLYERVRRDDLYFRATGGGVCFGGGEPLLHTAFLSEFRGICGADWRLYAQTALHVPPDAVRAAARIFDEFIVDCKDMDAGRYRRYTGADAGLAYENLRLLLSLTGAQRVQVRVPRIPEYNTDEDCARSVAILRSIGVKRIERFTYRTDIAP